MKKILLGAIVAISMVGFSSFKSVHRVHKKVSGFDYWFTVNSGWGSLSSFNNSQVTYYSGPDDAPVDDPCQGFGTYRCLVGFSESQVVDDHINVPKLKIIPGAIPSQFAADIWDWRTEE